MDDRPVRLGMDPRLVLADRDEATRPVGEGGPRPGLVQPAVEGRDDRDVAPPRQLEVPAIDVPVDEVEVAGPIEDHAHRLIEDSSAGRPRSRSGGAPLGR